MGLIKWIIIIVAILVVGVVILGSLDNDNNPPSNNNGNEEENKTPTPSGVNWEEVRAGDTAQVPSGWNTPKTVGVDSDLWEDGAYITGDGNTLYFALYSGDLINDVLKGEVNKALDVYQSNKPFTSKTKSSISENVWAEGGVMISGSDTYYMSNKYTADGKYDTDIYKNGERMSFSTSEDEDDPHYCAIKDELYFWKADSGENNIYVFTNDEIKKLPPPINSASNDIQPFLTPDCQTMYFTSNRGNKPATIYKSNRIGNDKWSEPEIIISSKTGVGEPTLTDDEKTLFFVQILRSDNGRFNADVLYTEKL